MPLAGTRGLGDVEAALPAMDSLDVEATVIEKVEILQVLFEIDSSLMLDLIPPALNPTIPPAIKWTFWKAAGGPLGPFTMAQTAIACRAGVRPRGFLTLAVVDSDSAGKELSSRWGFRTVTGDVVLERQYHKAVASVTVDGRMVLDLALLDPEPIAGNDLQYVANMNPARTPKGVRLVQVDPEFTFHKADRGRAELLDFDAGFWGDERVRPGWPVSASYSVADVTLPRLRYVCQPDVPALQGTEKVV